MYITNKIINIVDMLKFKVPVIEDNCLKKDFSKIYKNEKLESLETNLCKVKSLLDNPCKNANFRKVSYLFESFNCEKRKIIKMTNNFNITNAWLKAYELVDYFDLIPDKPKCRHFDNASFPGSFILAIHHYIKTVKKVKYNWYASSLNKETKNVKNHLDDIYKLYENYPQNWMISKENSGDLLDFKTLKYLKKNLPPIDLYTSDLGFDVSHDYNAQELLHLKSHYGQLLCGLMVLKNGGNLLVKQYTFFNEINIYNIGILTKLFKEVFISKPATSKSDNSEIYIVAKGYNKDEIILNSMIDEFTNWNPDSFKYDINSFGDEFINFIENITELLVKKQTKKIKLNINKFYEALNDPGDNIYKKAKYLFKNVRRSEVKKWYSQHKIVKIKTKNRLKMLDFYNQKKYILGKCYKE